MTLKNKILFSAAIAFFLTIGSFIVSSLNAPQRVEGSVAVGGENIATTTDIQANFANYTVLQGKNDLNPNNTVDAVPTVLSQITITTPGTSPFCLYDATTTVTNKGYATTTVACFPASATVGTYTFDAQYQRGLLIEFTGSPTATSRASTTISYR